MICKECSTEIKNTDQFCYHCGLENDTFIKRTKIPRKLLEDTPGFFSGIVREDFVFKAIFISIIFMIVFFAVYSLVML